MNTMGVGTIIAGRVCNLVPSKVTVEDYDINNAKLSDVWPNKEEILPQQVDLREDWWQIGDQEKTGSCVGWAVTDSALRYLLVKKNIISNEMRLSPRFTWMASKEFDPLVSRPESFVERAGTTIKSAADICRKYGAVLEEDVPFHMSCAMYMDDPVLLYSKAANRKITSYYNLFLEFKDWRLVLSYGVPIVIGIRPDRTFEKAAKKDGELEDFIRIGSSPDAHAVCVVGYLPDGRFIIRNSWGEKWGDKGFAYATERYLEKACFNEAYAFHIQ